MENHRTICEMTQPRKTDYGYSGLTFWENGDLKGYMKAYAEWEARPRMVSSGRKRTREIHPSWLPYLKYFIPTNPGRSQRAFCRWAGLNRGTFSAMQCKAIPMHVVELVGAWLAQGKEVENG